jgi:hypothetical protein
MLFNIARGLLAGALAVVTVLYTFRPRVPYPKWMLKPIEHPWLMPIIAVAIAFLFTMDAALGSMLILAVAAVALDMSIFGRAMYDEPIVGSDDLAQVGRKTMTIDGVNESDAYAPL